MTKEIKWVKEHMKKKINPQQAFLLVRSANFVYLHLLLYLLHFFEYNSQVLGLGKVQKVPCGLKLWHTTRILGEKVISTFKSKQNF